MIGDIRFYLSGADKPDGFQNQPSNCLGGYISTAEVKNGDLDSLFGGISEYTKTRRVPDFALIGIKNLGQKKTDVMIRVISPSDAYTSIKIAVVSPSQDADGHDIFESIENKSSQPYYADFSYDFLIPSIDRNQMFGIWIRREILPLALTPISVESLDAAFSNVAPINVVDDFILEVDYI